MISRASHLLIALALAACADPGGPAGGASASASAADSAAPTEATPADPMDVRDGSAVARAPADDLLYVADEDHSAIRVLGLPVAPEAEVGSVPMPGRPAQIVVTGSRVLATIRDVEGGGGALLVLLREGRGLREVGRVALPADAWGLALAPDASFAVVTSAWTAKVSVVDLAKLTVRATLEVAREPRGVTVLDGKHAFVTHLIGSGFTGIADLDGAPRVVPHDLPAAPLRAGKAALPASLGYALVASPDGKRVFFPRHALGAAVNFGWWGVGAVDIWLTDRGEALGPTRANGNFVVTAAEIGALEPERREWQPVEDHLPDEAGFVQPRAVVYRRSTKTLLVASEGTNAIVELDALVTNPTTIALRRYPLGKDKMRGLSMPTEGGAPSGIALSPAEDMAYVYCRSTDDLAAVRLQPGLGASVTVPPVLVRLAERDEKLAPGRALFYDASDGGTSGGLGCAGCHPDGREDGHVWHEATFVEHLPFASEDNKQTNFLGGTGTFLEMQRRWGSRGIKLTDGELSAGLGFPRQTPMLAGRVASTGPYGWHAENPDLESRIVVGMGLHRWGQGAEPSDQFIKARAIYLATFLRQGLVPPPRPERDLTPEEQQGKAIFESPASQCVTCHVPQTGLTDRFNPPMAVAAVAGFALEKDNRFKTPSLLYVGATAPYFHDGRYASLDELIDKIGDRMGRTSQLSSADKKALVAYLRTL